jgi:tetraacyldisaccharide 4'-kinase
VSYPVHEARGLRRLPDAASRDPVRVGLSLAYGAAARAAAALWDRGLRTPRRVPWPVVSVGALTAGGSGKTPVVRWLARELRARGARVGILTRGYGGAGGRAPRVVDAERPDARRDGDEPALLAAALPDVPVVVGPDRARGAALAADRGARLLLLDDGFQHRRLHRDVDLVLWDRRAERAAGALLPAGPLREPPAAIRRATAVLLVDRGDGAPAAPAGARETLAVRLRASAAPPLERGTAVHALSAIADPEGFERTLAAAGLRLTGATRFPDHHRFGADDVASAARRAASQGACVLAVTAKDRVRWPEVSGVDLPPCVFDLDVDVAGAEGLLARIASLASGRVE